MILNLKYIALFIFFAFALSDTIAQTKEKLDLNRGIDAYNNGDYGTAQDKFEKAYEANNQYNGALYNAANSAYRNGDFEKATEYYEQYAGTLDSKMEKAKVYHNLGNVFLKRFSNSEKKDDPEEKKKSAEFLTNSIEAYKNALRNNPSDEDTRYNLSYALSKLKQQQQQENKENKENKKDKEEDDKDKKENEDKKEGDKDKKEGEGDKEDKKNEDKDKEGDKPKPGDKDKEKEKEKEKEVEGKMSKGQIKKDLDAVNEDEKNILLKIAKQKGKKKEGNNTKDW